MYFRDMIDSCKAVVICCWYQDERPYVREAYEKNKYGKFVRTVPARVNLAIIEDEEKFITYVDSAYNGIYGYDWEYVNDVLIILTSIRKSKAIKPRSHEFPHQEKMEV